MWLVTTASRVIFLKGHRWMPHIVLEDIRWAPGSLKVRWYPPLVKCSGFNNFTEAGLIHLKGVTLHLDSSLSTKNNADKWSVQILESFTVVKPWLIFHFHLPKRKPKCSGRHFLFPPEIIPRQSLTCFVSPNFSVRDTSYTCDTSFKCDTSLKCGTSHTCDTSCRCDTSYTCDTSNKCD